jgi:DNA-binding HxlR family transcriptional regulator
MSSSVLYERLSDLVGAGLVAQDDARDYALTRLGRELGEAIAPLDDWATGWARTLATSPTQSGRKRR